MDKDNWGLEEGVFDRSSLIALDRFRGKGIVRTLDYCIAEGKEANVYRATKEDRTFAAIKIYRLRSPSFVHMNQYIEGDRRFSKIKGNSQALIFAWCQKEYRNLEIMHDAGIRVPDPIAFKANILAMEFLGENGVPFSRLVELGTEDPNGDYKLISTDVQKMKEIGMVHGDLSEFNILVTDKGPYIIDCGQAVLSTHPRAEEFYWRDMHNLWKYFKKFPGFDMEEPKKEE